MYKVVAEGSLYRLLRQCRRLREWQNRVKDKGSWAAESKLFDIHMKGVLKLSAVHMLIFLDPNRSTI